MNKKEVLVDTCFFQKLSDNGKNVDIFQRIMEDLEFKPIVHPYIAEHELDMFSWFHKLVEADFVRVADYKEFLQEDEDRNLYESYFFEIHDKLREHLEIEGSRKKLQKLKVPKGQTIFTYRKASMSLGDVHMVLMAFFMKIPIIFTEDRDIAALRSIIKRKMESASYSLDIFNLLDLFIMIAKKQDAHFSKKELENLIKTVGKKAYSSEIKQVWDDNH